MSANNGVVGYCNQCHRDVPIATTTKHTDGKCVNYCSFCGSTNIRVKTVNAANGLVFGTLNLFAGLHAARSSEEVSKE